MIALQIAAVAVAAVMLITLAEVAGDELQRRRR